MSKTKIIKNTLLLIIGLTPVTLLLVFLISGKSPAQMFPKLFPLISDEEIKQTKANCDNLVLPSSSKIRDRELVKSGLAVFEAEYVFNDNREDVREHFIDTLVSQGWEYSTKESGSEGSVFYKGKYTIRIEYATMFFSSENRYIVACSWKPNRHGIIGDLFEK